MKKLRSFVSLFTIVSFLIFPMAPVFALGEDLTPPPTPPPVETIVTPPADTTAPVISTVVAASVSTVAESVTWVTDELSTSTFEYGTTESYGSSASISGGLAIGGTAALTGLTAGTTYHYCIHATDASNNTANSCGHSFTTAAALDTTPPVVSLAVVTSIGNTNATFTWTTSEETTAQVAYGTSTSYGSQSTLDSALALTHSVALADLSPSTTYHYAIKSTDAAGNLTTTTDATFTTGSVSVQVSDTTPPVISEVSNVSLLSNAATIGWTTNELATSTLEYGTTTSYGSSATLDATALLVHDATILGLTPNTTYHYCIHATDLAGNVTNSCGHTFATTVAPLTPDTTAPVISNVASLSLGENEATIAWDTNEVAISTLEYGTTTSYGSHVTLSGSALLAHEATVTGLSANTTYHYCIHAADISGNARSSCSTFTTAAQQVVTDTTPPNITSVAVAPITTTSATVAFTTDEIANTQIEYGTTEGYGMMTTFDPNLALTHAVQISSLTPNTLYHYRIITSDQLGNETIGFDETFTTHAVVTVPSTTMAISNVETAGLSTTSATIAWTTTLPSDSQIEYGDSESFGQSTALSTTLTTEHSVTIGELSPGTNYIFRVKSKPSGVMIATVSQNYEFNTLGVAVPVVPPANILSVSHGTPTSTAVSVTWTTDKAATSQVEYGISTSYGQSSTETMIMQTSHTITLSDLTPNTTYHYRVKSIDEVGNITYSEDYTFITPASSGLSGQSQVQVAPSAITTLAVGGYDQESVNLVWHASSTGADVAAEYDIRYSTSPITSSNWANTITAQTTPIYYGDLSPSGTERSYIVAGLSPHTTYYFALVSKFENTEWSDLSNIVSVTTTQNTSVNNETASVSSGGGSGSVSGTSSGYGASSGGNATGSYEPTVVKATPADNEIIFSWDNPGEANFVRTVVVRKED